MSSRERTPRQELIQDRRNGKALAIASISLCLIALTALVAGRSEELPIYRASVRDRGERSIQVVNLEGLSDPYVLETDDFRVVEGKAETPIDLRKADADLQLRATSALYNLQRAARFFRERFGVDPIHRDPSIVDSRGARVAEKLTIRLNLTNRYSDVGHYMNDRLDPAYNEAVALPAGRALEGMGVEPWGAEIWFRPRKETPGDDAWVDTALVPEIAYRELARQALSEPTKIAPTPAVEAMADYFAAAAADSPKFAVRTHRPANDSPAEAARALSLLWGLRELLGADFADRAVFEARKYLDSSATDAGADLARALGLACAKLDPKCDGLRLARYFADRER